MHGGESTYLWNKNNVHAEIMCCRPLSFGESKVKVVRSGETCMYVSELVQGCWRSHSFVWEGENHPSVLELSSALLGKFVPGYVIKSFTTCGNMHSCMHVGEAMSKTEDVYHACQIFHACGNSHWWMWEKGCHAWMSEKNHSCLSGILIRHQNSAGIWKQLCTMHPRKTECGCPSGGGIKNGHVRYPYCGGTQKQRMKKRRIYCT